MVEYFSFYIIQREYIHYLTLFPFVKELLHPLKKNNNKEG